MENGSLVPEDRLLVQKEGLYKNSLRSKSKTSEKNVTSRFRENYHYHM